MSPETLHWIPVSTLPQAADLLMRWFLSEGFAYLARAYLAGADLADAWRDDLPGIDRARAAFLRQQ